MRNESESTKVWPACRNSDSDRSVGRFDDFTVTHSSTGVSQATDYGVWGDVLTEQKQDILDKYRYAYQGQFAEKDEETGWSHFELREYDPEIGRWMVPDPYKQYPSPYVAFGNNPAYKVDPNGGCDICPTFRAKNQFDEVGNLISLKIVLQIDAGAQVHKDKGVWGINLDFGSAKIVSGEFSFYFDLKNNEIIYDIQGSSAITDLAKTGTFGISHEVMVDLGVLRVGANKEGTFDNLIETFKSSSGISDFVQKYFSDATIEYGAPFAKQDTQGNNMSGLDFGYSIPIIGLFQLDFEGSIWLNIPDRFLEELTPAPVLIAEDR